ncbi:uncharacterized protein [Montipora foliosa]
MANDQIKELGGTQASIIIIITDGRIEDIIPATDLTKKARQAGAAVYVIGIAAFVRSDLERLANKPPQYFVFTEPNYKLLKNLTDDIANKSCVELTSVNPKQACLGENSTVTLIGRGFIKFSVAVWCGFSLNATYRQATRALAVEDNRLICPVPALKDTNSSFMLQVSMNNGTTFVSSNVNITAKNCIQPTEPIARVELTSVDPKEVCLGAADRRCYDWNLVCSCGGGSAQRQNVCDTPSNDTIPDRYLPIGLVTEGKKSQSPYFVEHCNISVLCMGKARAPRWLKRKAKRCKKDVKRRCFDWNLVCSHGGGGGAQRHNDCDTLPNDTFPDRYLPIGLVTEGNQSHSPYFVEHCNVSVLCMGKAIAPRWPKSKAKPCKKGNTTLLPYSSQRPTTTPRPSIFSSTTVAPTTTPSVILPSGPSALNSTSIQTTPPQTPSAPGIFSLITLIPSISPSPIALGPLNSTSIQTILPQMPSATATRAIEWYYIVGPLSGVVLSALIVWYLCKRRMTATAR